MIFLFLTLFLGFISFLIFFLISYKIIPFDKNFFFFLILFFFLPSDIVQSIQSTDIEQIKSRVTSSRLISISTDHRNQDRLRLDIVIPDVVSQSIEKGEKLFIANCNVCHIQGKNLIIPEKNLKKKTLDINGMNSVNSIVYQIINGKNGMPAFGGRLMESEIQEIALYVLHEANKVDSSFQT